MIGTATTPARQLPFAAGHIKTPDILCNIGSFIGVHHQLLIELSLASTYD